MQKKSKAGPQVAIKHSILWMKIHWFILFMSPTFFLNVSKVLTLSALLSEPRNFLK